MSEKRVRRTRPPVTIVLPSSARGNNEVLQVSDRQLNDLWASVNQEYQRKLARKPKSRSTRLGEAIEMVADAKMEIEELYGELENWKEGMEGTNLEYSMKYEELETAMDLLYQMIDSLEVLDGADGEVEFPSMF